jgi:V/A-type H+/Na+-transporting ATPase subunit I
MKAEEMVKLRIFCARTALKEVINELHTLNAIDIIEHKSIEGLDIGTPLSESTIFSEAVLSIRRTLYQLEIEPDPDLSAEIIEDLEKEQKFIEKIDNLTNELYDRKKEIENLIKILTEEYTKLRSLNNLGLNLDYLKDTKTLSFYIGYVQDGKIIRKELKEKIGEEFELVSSLHEDKEMLALYVPKEKDTTCFEILRKNGFIEFKLPQRLDKDALEKTENKIVSLKKEEKQIEKKILKIKKEEGFRLQKLERSFSILSQKADAPLLFGETKNIAIITGWIPEKKRRLVLRRINDITGNSVFIEKLAIHKDDEVPIKLGNYKLVKPYEFLLRMFSMPSYKELDPSIFMFITFPLFFGFMLGDIGYGLTTLFLFTFLKTKIPKAKDLLNIMIYCSISSIIFGFIYGEFYGFELSHWHWVENLANTYLSPLHLHYPFIHRSAHTALELIKLSLIIGAIHVNIGLILGFINVWKAHGLKHAIFEKVSWFVLEIGVAIIALSSMGLIPLKMWDGIIIVIIAAVMLFLGEGVQGLVELPSIFIHMGSYLRLMAIGLASVGLAVVINEQAAPLFQQGISGIIGGILIFTLGHIINIALGIIGPFLHSLRLHYVEYFTKFYKGGGKEYCPFGSE